jgi:DNA-binding NarL/FixJ family response regulator
MATVVTGKFEDLVAKGLEVVIGDDPNLDLAARDVPLSEIESVAANHSPAVVLLNFAALGSPVEVQAITQRLPDARVLVLANRPTAAECTQMLSFGATGCLSKETEARDVVNAIHLASRGMHVLPPAVIDEYEPPGPELLTPRESEVLELLQAGQSNAEIAQALHVSIETVRTHARRVYRKLGVRTRRELRARQ